MHGLWMEAVLVVLAQAQPNCLDSVGSDYASIFINSDNNGRILSYFSNELDQTSWSGVEWEY